MQKSVTGGKNHYSNFNFLVGELFQKHFKSNLTIQPYTPYVLHNRFETCQKKGTSRCYRSGKKKRICSGARKKIIMEQPKRIGKENS